MKQKRYSIYVIFFVVGMFLGVLVANLLWDEQDKLKDYIGLTNMMRIVVMKIDTAEYIKYLFAKRMAVALVLFLCTMTIIGSYLFPAFIMYLGICFGNTLSYLISQYHIRGCGLLFALIFPQMFFYIPAIIGYLDVLTALHYKIFEKPNMLYLHQKKQFNFIKLGKIVGVTIIGIVLECYVNPIFVKIMIKNL